MYKLLVYEAFSGLELLVYEALSVGEQAVALAKVRILPSVCISY